ncbi:MAG TPA: hypothetical protein VNA68_01390 [Candidatus Dormibacteraeota bacterium]|nr:hypothetical protein [Candidatus Dormibacteraeota bacterium]
MEPNYKLEDFQLFYEEISGQTATGGVQAEHQENGYENTPSLSEAQVNQLREDLEQQSQSLYRES